LGRDPGLCSADEETAEWVQEMDICTETEAWFIVTALSPHLSLTDLPRRTFELTFEVSTY